MILTALGPIAAYRMHMPKWAAMPASGAGATLVSYTVQLSKVVDFRGGYQPVTWPELWEEFACDWRKLWFDRSIEPPSWVLAEEANTVCVRSRTWWNQPRDLHVPARSTGSIGSARPGRSVAEESRFVALIS
jgi:hypothetical protein